MEMMATAPNSESDGDGDARQHQLAARPDRQLPHDDVVLVLVRKARDIHPKKFGCRVDRREPVAGGHLGDDGSTLFQTSSVGVEAYGDNKSYKAQPSPYLWSDIPNAIHEVPRQRATHKYNLAGLISNSATRTSGDRVASRRRNV